MERRIRAVTEREMSSTLDFVEKVFTDSENNKAGLNLPSLLY